VAGVTLIKVCGLTRAEDVRLAAELGAWALGFVLTESPRRIDASRAAELIAALAPGGADASRESRHAAPSPRTVLVVTTEPAEWIAEALAASGADGVQLSAGAEGATVAEVRAAAASLRRRPLVVAAADTPDAQLADYVLLDARTPGAYGGTGETLDWEALAADPRTPRAGLVLAGGLRPANVAEAIRALRPGVVDVSSGVETGPGRKDHAALRDFFAAVEHADREAEAAGADGASLPAAQP
jgi:phosphoribosylanthranilate isomerase